MPDLSVCKAGVKVGYNISRSATRRRKICGNLGTFLRIDPPLETLRTRICEPSNSTFVHLRLTPTPMDGGAVFTSLFSLFTEFPASFGEFATRRPRKILLG